MKPVAPFLRTPYNYDTNKAGDESGLKCEDPSRTKQSFTEETDINTIVKRFALTGELPTNVRMPEYGDFTGISTYHEALNAIKTAEESFYAMPAQIRSRFNNDPEQFVAFCADDNNRDEAESMGLVSPRPKPEKVPEPTGTPPETPPAPSKGKKTDT